MTDRSASELAAVWQAKADEPVYAVCDDPFRPFQARASKEGVQQEFEQLMAETLRAIAELKR